MITIKLPVQDENYEIIAIVDTGFCLHEGTQKEYHAIIKRHNNSMYPYIVATSYDISDGTWGDSARFENIDKAKTFFRGLI